MHSGELARRAGVSVRALRHYHQVGVLDEPARSSNGYRDYDVDDLVRVLRIRRMAGVGIPLDQMPALLDEAPDSAGDLLDDLDRELGDQMDRLARQRALIARLREDQAPPDLPPELARFLAALGAAVPSTERARTDRDQSVLLAHLVGEEGMPHLARFYERLSDPLLIPTVNDLTERFDRLGDDTGEQDVDALVESFVATFAPMVSDLAASERLIDLSASAALFTEFTIDRLNERQRRTLEHIEARLDQHREE